MKNIKWLLFVELWLPCLLILVLSTPAVGDTAKSKKKKLKATSITPVLREVQRVLQKRPLSSTAFMNIPKKLPKESIHLYSAKFDNWKLNNTFYGDYIDSLRNLKLFTEDLWTMVIPTKVYRDDRGSLLFEGYFKPRKRTKIPFVVQHEQVILDRWSMKYAELGNKHKSKIASCHLQYPHHGTYHGHHQTAHHDTHMYRHCLELENKLYKERLVQFDMDRNHAIQPIHTAILSRKEEFITTQTIAIGNSDLADKLDLAKIIKAKKIKIMFKVSDITLNPPTPNSKIPARPSILTCSLIDVDKMYYLKKPKD